MKKVSSWKLYFFGSLIKILPLTKFWATKRLLISLCGVLVDRGVRIVSSAKFQTNGELIIKKNTWIGHNVFIVGGDSIVYIGESCDLAPNVLIATGTHEILTNLERAAGKSNSLPVFIDDGVWVCAGAIILGGTRIGQCSVVAAGAVVK